MLAITIERANEPARRKTFAEHDIVIGSARDCDVVLTGRGVAGRHTRIMIARDNVLVVPMIKHAVKIDGKRALSPLIVQPTSVIRFANYAITARRMYVEAIEDAPPVQIRGAHEQGLLDAIAGGDRASRLVYADWLEERGDAMRAEYLRVQYSLFEIADGDPTVEERGDRLRELAAAIGDLAWRSRVAMQQVEGCSFEVSCPREWDAMARTERDGVRHCSACNKHVMYCATVEEARGWAALGACVALDITAPRWQSDLAPPFGAYRCDECDIDVGRHLAYCPRCAQPLVRMMVRGMIG